MPDRPAISGRPPATAVGGRPGGDGGPRGGVRAVWAVARRVLTGRPVRWGFAAAAVAIGGYAVARQWTDVRASLASIGALMVAAAMVSVLIAMFAAMQVWRVLLTALVTLPFFAGSTPYLWAFLAAPGLLACLHPKVLNSVLERLFRLTRRPPLEQPLTARAIATSLAWSCGSWIFYGLQIWLLATRFGAPRGQLAFLALGGFALAWILGFVAVFAPAGAGVREVVLVAVLGPVIGVAAGTAVALVSRALTTIGDLLAAAVAAGYFRRTRARSWDVARSNPK